MTAPAELSLNDMVVRAVVCVERCNFSDGMQLLGLAAQQVGGINQLPPRALAAYAVAVAATDRSHRGEAVKLAKAAITRNVVDPQLYHALARVYLMARSKRRAISTIEAGLRVDPEDQSLLDMQAKLGVRSRPVIGFLQRSHPLNVFFGRLRHRMTRTS